MQILLILLCLFGNTEFFNKHGKKIAEDKHGKDGKISIITDKKAAKLLAQKYKNGELVTKTNPRITVEVTKIVLEEALHTLKRTENNGGLREECSIVTAQGEILRGETGALPNKKGVATTTLPLLKRDKNRQKATSIHSHPLKIQVGNKTVYPQVTNPSFDIDLWTFPKYGTNIIVGNIHQPSTSLVGTKKTTTVPSKGVAIYKKGRGEKPVLVLTKRVVKKIIY
jgi:hypothetical protein